MKKIFKTDSETVEVKELQKKIVQVESVLNDLKLFDPLRKIAFRREKIFDIVSFFIFLVLMFLSSVFCFHVGCEFGLKQAESIYNYSVTTGYIIPEE